MIRNVFNLLKPLSYRSMTNTKKIGKIIDGKSLARDIKTLLRNEVKEWAERIRLYIPR